MDGPRSSRIMLKPSMSSTWLNLKGWAMDTLWTSTFKATNHQKTVQAWFPPFFQLQWLRDHPMPPISIGPNLQFQWGHPATCTLWFAESQTKRPPQSMRALELLDTFGYPLGYPSIASLKKNPSENEWFSSSWPPVTSQGWEFPRLGPFSVRPKPFGKENWPGPRCRVVFNLVYLHSRAEWSKLGTPMTSKSMIERYIHIYIYIYTYIYIYIPSFYRCAKKEKEHFFLFTFTKVTIILSPIFLHVRWVPVPGHFLRSQCSAGRTTLASWRSSTESTGPLNAGWWLTYPFKQHVKVNWDDYSQQIEKSKKCSKPPTRNVSLMNQSRPNKYLNCWSKSRRGQPLFAEWGRFDMFWWLPWKLDECWMGQNLVLVEITIDFVGPGGAGGARNISIPKFYWLRNPAPDVNVMWFTSEHRRNIQKLLLFVPHLPGEGY